MNLKRIKGDPNIDRQRSCAGKNFYGWALPATRAAYLLSEFRREDFEVYRCRYCGYWHIGHVKDRSIFDYSYPDALYNNDSPFHL